MPFTHCMKKQPLFVCIELTPHFTCWPFLLVLERTVNSQSLSVSMPLTVCRTLPLPSHLFPRLKSPSFLSHSLLGSHSTFVITFIALSCSHLFTPNNLPEQQTLSLHCSVLHLGELQMCWMALPTQNSSELHWWHWRNWPLGLLFAMS